MPQININLLAVLVSAIASMIIGAFWYSPLLFGKIWMELMKIDKKKLAEMKKKGVGKSYVIAFIGALITSYVLGYFIDYVGATGISQGTRTAFLLWLGFVVPTLLNSILWEGKPVKLYLLNISHHLVSLITMGAILVVWI